MRNAYLVIVDQEFPRKDFLETLNDNLLFGTWFYSMPNSFFVYSHADANGICNLIKSRYGDRYNFFITEISDGNRQGWMPKKHWDIIRAKGAEKVFRFEFNGYYIDASTIPESSGVFCIYRCVYNGATDKVSISELLQVGGATNIRQFLSLPCNVAMCQQCCNTGEQLCFSFATVPEEDIRWGREALLYSKKGRCNQERLNGFDHADTFIITTGTNKGLKSEDLIERLQHE